MNAQEQAQAMMPLVKVQVAEDHPQDWPCVEQEAQHDADVAVLAKVLTERDALQARYDAVLAANSKLEQDIGRARVALLKYGTALHVIQAHGNFVDISKCSMSACKSIWAILSQPPNAALLRVQEAKEKVVEAAGLWVLAKTPGHAEALQGELYDAVKALEAAERAAKDGAK